MSLFQKQFMAMSAACWVLAACASEGAGPAMDEGGLDGIGAGTGGTAGSAGIGGAAGTAGSGGTGGLDVAGSGGTAGDSMLTADAGPDAQLATDASTDAAVERTRPRCLANGNQVVLIGDSYINWVSHTFPADLFKEAGATFRNYAQGAYSMGSGGIGFIPPQMQTAIMEDPDINTIVMTGGGNDVLVADTMQFPKGGDCKMTNDSPNIPDCRAIVDKAIGAADKMLQDTLNTIEQMGLTGTRDVVYFFYPNVPEPTLVGGNAPNAILDYAAPLVEAFCAGVFERTEGKAECHFVDLRPVFKGHPEYFAPTDIHPNGAGSAAMAKAVWKTMKDNCLAQPASSGCCEP